jgi:SWIM zinc finger
MTKTSQVGKPVKRGTGWKVPSSHGHGWYFVSGDFTHCSCPAFARGHQRPCKHIEAARQHAVKA